MRRSAALVLAGLVGIACAAPQSPPSPTTQPGPSLSPAVTIPLATPPVSPVPSGEARVMGWRADIAALVPGMDALHPMLDHGVSLAQLNAAAAKLADEVPELTDDQVLDGVMTIVAMVSSNGCDGHTGAFVWGDGNYPVSSMPLRLWLFGDGVYIVDALDPYRDLIGGRIESIAGVSVDDVIATLAPLVPRDNAWTVRLLTPRYLLMPEALSGVGVPAGRTTSLGVVDAQGASTTVDVQAIAQADYNAWAGPYGLLLPANPDVPYLSRETDILWWQPLDGGTLFVQYNDVQSVPQATLAQLRDAATAPGVKRVVFDLRHNTGADVKALDSMVQLLAETGIDRPGRLFVITGRNTFSAAGMLVARVQDQTQASIVGEPMSGCPTTWGNSRSFTLPYSKISVSVSTLLEVGVAADDKRDTIQPDISAPLTFSDWSAGKDPALDAIEAAGQ